MDQGIIELLRRILPPVFAGPTLNERTSDTLKWESVQNWRSLGQISERCFSRVGGGRAPTIVDRDLFLDELAVRPTRAPGTAAEAKPPRRSRRAAAEAPTA